LRWLPWPAPGQLAAILTGVLAAAGPVVWNAILRATPASQFFTDTPPAAVAGQLADTAPAYALATATSSGLGHWPPPRPGTASG
jgi:hypothetical protein